MTPNHREANVTRWIDGSVGQSGDESSSGSSVALEYRMAAVFYLDIRTGNVGTASLHNN